MESNKNNPDILKNLFRQMPEEELPASFRLHMMQQITREAVKMKKRNERFGLAAVIAASLGMLGMAAASFFYIGMPRIRWPEIDLPVFSFYFYIGMLTLFLLFIDYKLRKAFRKDE